MSDIENRVFRAAELNKMGRYELMQVILDLDADVDKANKKWEDLKDWVNNSFSDWDSAEVRVNKVAGKMWDLESG
ncbi:MAG TPA: hypothetical protein EYN67_14035 [Flavobacteriales bacterium]|nr:hypothetical protein [Flavobacteriales bacterium]